MDMVKGAEAMKGRGAVVVTLVAAVVLLTTTARASGLVGMYALIERVVLEPNAQSPERIQVWGAFAYANGGVGDGMIGWSDATRGYMYFALPTLVTPDDRSTTLIRREWADLTAVAGTGQVVAFGRWGYIGRFDVLTGDGAQGPHMFLERAPWGGERTDLRIRGAGETPRSPAAYQFNAGVVRIPAEGTHRALVAQLRAAAAR